MIVFESQRKLIITPPHTASGNLHRALCCDRYGGRWVIGPNADGEADHHFAQLAPDWLDYDVAVVVRHPLDRAIGLYEHHKLATEKHNWEPTPWWMFAAMVCMKHPDLSWFYRYSIFDLVGDDLIARATLLQFESLANDLSAFVGAAVTLPGRSWTVDRSPYLRECGPCCQIQWHWSNDLERFGYQPLV